jgi:Peptidase M16 inactive domain
MSCHLLNIERSPADSILTFDHAIAAIGPIPLPMLYLTEYDMSALSLSLQDTGLFGIYLVCDEDKAEDAVKYSLENLLRLSYNITDEEVLNLGERGREGRKGRNAMGWDGMAALSRTPIRLDVHCTYISLTDSNNWGRKVEETRLRV